MFVLVFVMLFRKALTNTLTILSHDHVSEFPKEVVSEQEKLGAI